MGIWGLAWEVGHLSGVTRMLEFFSDSSDSDLEGCHICFIVCVQMYASLLLSSSSFLLNLSFKLYQ